LPDLPADIKSGLADLLLIRIRIHYLPD